MRTQFPFFEARYLRIKSAAVTDVWFVSTPISCLSPTRSEKERERIIEEFTERYPYRQIWLSDLAAENETWKRIERTDALAAIGDLNAGGWALFFFTEDLPLPERSLDQVSLEPTQAVAQLRTFSASAGIYSLVDDTEWVVAIRNDAAGSAG